MRPPQRVLARVDAASLGEEGRSGPDWAGSRRTLLPPSIHPDLGAAHLQWQGAGRGLKHLGGLFSIIPCIAPTKLGKYLLNITRARGYRQ